MFTVQVEQFAIACFICLINLFGNSIVLMGLEIDEQSKWFRLL